MTEPRQITAPGIYDMPAAVYHADPCPEKSISNSDACIIVNTATDQPDICPARLKAAREAGERSTAAMDDGKAAHAWLLEGGDTPKGHTLLPEDHSNRTKAGKALVAEIEAAGNIPLPHSRWLRIQAMADALRKHPVASALFTDGLPERSLFWRDPESGVMCRCRPDWLPSGLSAAGRMLLPDYKTTVSVRDGDLARSMANFAYFRQAAWYADGVRELGLAEDVAFLFVSQEREPPYITRVWQPEPEAVAWGAMINAKARSVFAACVASGEWPDYDPMQIVYVALPAWKEKRLQDAKDAGILDTMARWQRPIDEPMDAPVSTAAE